MKLEKLFSALWAFLISFALSLATTMCVVTAFHLGIDTGFLIRTCLLAALVCSVCYALPLSLVPLGCGAAFLGYWYQQGILEASLEAFLNRLTRQYDRAYGWGIIRWGHRLADEMEPDIVFMLCIFGALIALLCAWAVCRRKTVLPALGASLLTFATCFVVNDTVPDVPWLFLLILCFLLLILTGSVRRQDEKQGNRLCLMLTPVTALALLILFAAIPREDYRGQAAAKKFADSILQSDSMQLLLGHMDDSSAVGGITNVNAVDLKGVGYRVETHAQVMQVTAPYTGTVYLRGRSMDYYDGTSWQQSDIKYDPLYWPGLGLEDAGEFTVTTRFAHRLLYAPYYVTTTDTKDIAPGLINEKSLTEYSFSCRMPAEPTSVPDRSYLSSSHPAVPPMERFIRMERNVQNWAQPLAQKLISGEQDAYSIARILASYVRNSASYDTRTARMPAREKDFARWFLEDSSTGYCVHFATATTVLLQAVGIPARYVTGYYAQVTEGEPITVYSDQAHAWTEYWVPGFGWTVLEATPPDFAAEPEETTEATVSTTLPQAPGDTTPEQTIPNQTGTPEPQPKANRDWVLWVLLSIVAVCALITAAEGQRRIRRMLRSRKLAASSPNEKALLYWQDTTLYARLLNEAPDKDLFRLAQKAKFSQYTLTEEELQQFAHYAQRSAEKLHRHNLFRRLYYRIILAIC